MKKILLLSILLVCTQFMHAQRTICGTVTDQSSGEVMIGVTVLLKGTPLGTVTDFDGKYCLEIPVDVKKDELEFSYVGFDSKSVKIEDSDALNVKMIESTTHLDEMFIVKYGYTKTTDATVTGDEIKAASAKNYDLGEMGTRGFSSIYSPPKATDLSAKSKPKKPSASMYPPPAPPPPPVAEPTSYSITSEKLMKKVSSMETKDIRGGSLGDAAILSDKIELGKEDMFMMSSDDFDDAPAESPQSNVRAGLLTAGEINDFGKWTMWQDMTEGELNMYQKEWNFFTNNRYTVQVSTQSGKPIVDAQVRLLTAKNTVYWSAKTDNTGKAELWLNMFEDSKEQTGDLRLEVTYDGKKETVKEPTLFQQGINFVTLKADCNIPQRADVLFVVDATSSMGDEINFLKAELQDVILQVQKQRTDLDIHLGSVFYRDKGDEYVTKKSEFSPRIEETVQFIQQNGAAGGGDYEEAVEEALNVAVNDMQWSDNAVVRLLFLVLDAPPHQTPEIKEKLQQITRKAAKKGIRIVPVTASGLNKSTEYLMRSLALATNGTYTFLTDHSGIGGSHIAPSTDDYDMEFLNDLLIRLIDQFTQTSECDENNALIEAAKAESISEEVLKILNYYPNPVASELTIELKADIAALFVTDLSGKILQRLEKLQPGKVLVDMSLYPSGIYFLRYTTIEGKEGSAKVMVVK
ncbi:MAG: carboxypeptidase-like regulatory domain-containing protein [Chitinophagales bacterium]